MDTETRALAERVHDVVLEWQRVANAPAPEPARDENGRTYDRDALEAVESAIDALAAASTGAARDLRVGLALQVGYLKRERDEVLGWDWDAREESSADFADALADLFVAFEIEVDAELAASGWIGELGARGGRGAWGPEADPIGALEAVRAAAREIRARVDELGSSPWTVGARGIAAQASLMEQSELLREREWELAKGAHALAARRMSRAVRMLCRGRVIAEMGSVWGEVAGACEGLVESVGA